jgi:hypothetical protein
VCVADVAAREMASNKRRKKMAGRKSQKEVPADDYAARLDSGEKFSVVVKDAIAAMDEKSEEEDTSIVAWIAFRDFGRFLLDLVYSTYQEAERKDRRATLTRSIQGDAKAEKMSIWSDLTAQEKARNSSTDLSDILDEMSEVGVLDLAKGKPARLYPGPRRSEWKPQEVRLTAAEKKRLAKAYG